MKELQALKDNLPELRSGANVRVTQQIKEGDKERLQTFEGLLIKVNAGHGVGKTITVRKVVEGIGVEKIFPIHAPSITKIEVTKRSKVRRAKLYYIREKLGKGYKLYEEKEGVAKKAAKAPTATSD